MKKKLMVEGMNCGKCAGRVKAYFDDVQGVEEVTVNLKDKRVEVSSKNDFSVSELVNSLEGTKFSIVEVD